MKVHQLNALDKGLFKNPTVTIGFFDGVHIGHIEIINSLKKIAIQQHGETVLVTLWPHPRQVLFPEKKLKLLNTLDEKINTLSQQKIHHLVLLPFDKDISELSAEAFVKGILIDKIGIKHLLAGHDNHFGRNREGSFEKLTELASKYNFNITKHEAVFLGEEKVNSSEVRVTLELGQVDKAARMLGYNYTITGKVIEGRKVGRTIGFPTANLRIDDFKLIPGAGVYAVWVKANSKTYAGMLNIGFRPTFENENASKSIEVHLIDFEGNLYDSEISVSFVARIRNEQKFENINALIDQLNSDKTNALKILV